MADFLTHVTEGYKVEGDSITLGCAMHDGKVVAGANVTIPLKTLNRHGLIAGATGTGKTKTLQRFAELLSENEVSVLMMDIKGDVSGLGAVGTMNDKIKERAALTAQGWNPQSYPVELMTISKEQGVRLRATVSEFGPVLFSKILELNDNQAGVVSIVFKYCDDNKLPLLDLKDFRKVVQYLCEEGKDEIKAKYGQLAPATVSVINRKLIELETQGAEQFFGETSFDVNDLLRKDPRGLGYINILRLCDIQDKPKLFSTFMLSLLAELYQAMPEIGDKAAPKLVIIIDEAHLIFNEASSALLNQLETIIKLIRSKGVGIYFCTQQPTDIPENILSQLGLKIQHALRAFTAKDRKSINLVAENYPSTDFYKVDELLTQLGIGEALVTALNEKGIPTPLVHAMMHTPQSRMDVLTTDEQTTVISNSALATKYNTEVDRESAFEMLNEKLKKVTEQKAEEEEEKKEAEEDKPRKGEKSTFEQVINNSAVKTVIREVARGLLGAFFGKRR